MSAAKATVPPTSVDLPAWTALRNTFVTSIKSCFATLPPQTAPPVIVEKDGKMYQTPAGETHVSVFVNASLNGIRFTLSFNSGSKLAILTRDGGGADGELFVSVERDPTFAFPIVSGVLASIGTGELDPVPKSNLPDTFNAQFRAMVAEHARRHHTKK